MVFNWDIYLEMIMYMCVIDFKMGRLFVEINEGIMENWYFYELKSVDEFVNYMVYVLRIFECCDFFCEGIIMLGGFGNCVK